MELIGSVASPFVRRIRLYLGDTSYKFSPINVFSKEGQAQLSMLSPIRKVPLLIDGDKVIWDSLLIYEYIKGAPLSLEDKKELYLVNELTDAGLILYQSQLGTHKLTDEDLLYANSRKRIEEILKYFTRTNLEEWSLTNQWLYCTLDWFDFRSVYPWKDEYPSFISFMQRFEKMPFIESTDPRN